MRPQAEATTPGRSDRSAVGYCIPEDVTPLISLVGTLSDQTQLTDAGVDVLITQVSAEIDGHLRAKGYLLPVADPEALGALKATCQSGAAARILRSLFPAAGRRRCHAHNPDRGLAAADERPPRWPPTKPPHHPPAADKRPHRPGRASDGR